MFVRTNLSATRAGMIDIEFEKKSILKVNLFCVCVPDQIYVLLIHLFVINLMDTTTVE